MGITDLKEFNVHTYTKNYSKNKCTLLRGLLRIGLKSIILDLLYHNEITEHLKVGHRKKMKV